MSNLSKGLINSAYGRFNKVFIDNSKEDWSLGVSFYVAEQKISLKLQISANMCILETELIAISKALSYVESSKKLSPIFGSMHPNPN